MMKLSNSQLCIWARYPRSGLEVKFENNHGDKFFIVAVGYFWRLYRMRKK